MIRLLSAWLVTTLLCALGGAAMAEEKLLGKYDSIYQIPVEPMQYAIDNKTTESAGNLAPYRGDVLLIVNVASKCGLTPQYKQLEALSREYRGRGLRVLGFPSNDFLGQEPGTEQDIRTFCSTKYDVTFPLFAKIRVKGDERAPLYQYLTRGEHEFTGEIGWNFTKFLIGRDGRIAARFSPRTKPDDKKVVAAIESALAAPAPEQPQP